VCARVEVTTHLTLDLIRQGSDHGYGECFFSLKIACRYSNKIKIHFLYKVSSSIRQGTIFSSWLDSEEIGLGRAQASEWDLFCRSLMGTGVQILRRQDELR
jgi:hypothetical protein